MVTPYAVWYSGVGNWAFSDISGLQGGMAVTGNFQGNGYGDIAVYYNLGNQVELVEFSGSSSGLGTPYAVWYSGVGNWAWNQIIVA